MSTANQIEIRPPARPGLWLWLKKNLFSSWSNSLLTVLSVIVIYYTLRGLGRWALFEADWSPVVESLRLFAVGTYPIEQVWRVWIIIYLVSFLAGMSAGKWHGTVSIFARAMVFAFLLLALLPISLEYMGLDVRLQFGLNILLIGLGFFLADRLPIQARWLFMAWGASFVVTLLLLRGFRNSAAMPLISSGQWGGLLLTFLLAVIGITACFPIGVLLALGRQSKLPILKALCIVFIETVRGVPLVTILFMTSICGACHLRYHSLRCRIHG